PEAALPLYHSFCERLSADCGAPVAVGRFGADMRVESINDGPVTILIDSRARE
ncbi:MAG: D-aminoacyl-tRNA deacylase, partial [Planctomycetes bacterium]|nr:D-aminoacyl-tRNA deacylase [Planctomycetota bacterium]